MINQIKNKQKASKLIFLCHFLLPFFKLRSHLQFPVQLLKQTYHLEKRQIHFEIREYFETV